MNAVLTPDTPGMIAGAGEAEDPAERKARDLSRWEETLHSAYALMDKTRDLRVDTMILAGHIRQGEIEGVAAGAKLIRAHLETFWDDLHPVMDPDDGFDPTARCNAFSLFEDRTTSLALYDLPIVPDPMGVAITLEEVEIFRGRRAVDEEEERNSLNLRVADSFAKADLAVMADRAAAAHAAIDDLCEIESFWAKRMADMTEFAATDAGAKARNTDFTVKPDFSALVAALSQGADFIEMHLPKTQEDAFAEQSGAGPDGDISGARVAGAVDIISSRAVAEVALGKISAWFKKNEPSSPVPVLVDRARRLISLSFVEIIDELGDSGMSELRKMPPDGGGDE